MNLKSLAAKLIASFALISLLIVGLASLTFYSLRELAELQDHGATLAIQALDAAALQMKTDELYGIIADSVINRNTERTKTDWEKLYNDTQTLLEKVGKSLETEQDQQKVQVAQQGFKDMDNLFKQVIAGLQGVDPSTIPVLVTSLDGKIDGVREKTDNELTLISKSLMNEAVQGDITFDTIRTRTIWTIAIVSVFVTLFSLLFGIFYGRSIASSLRSMATSLVGCAQQVSSASDELSNAAQQLSEGANQQASAIEETSASLEEMGGMVQNNVNNAQKATDLSNQIKQVSQVSNDAMSKLETSMREILASNKKIEDLVKVIDEIGQKTKIMDEIVFQTKLLSFNASVEAERAGEHGRGFAVVAQEVGNLAQMSGKAAQEIAQIVNSSIKQAEVISSENRAKVEAGNIFVSETGKYLNDIMRSATTVVDGSSQVLSASKEQASGIKQINIAMSNLDRATQDNAAMAEQTASTSEELNAQTETLKVLAADLVRLVDGVDTNSAVNHSQKVIHLDTKRSTAMRKAAPLKIVSQGKTRNTAAKIADF